MTDIGTTVLPALLDKAAIKVDQDGIKVSLKGLDERIHNNAVQCLLHAEKHGDTSLMRRLLVDIIDAKSGYRRQGIIAWMKEFSPMRLDGDNIKLTGMAPDGLTRQAFRCEEANKTPFTELASAREVVALRPIFRDGLTDKIARAIKEYKDGVANTEIVPGVGTKPKDPKKPYYNGVRLSEVEASLDKLNNVLAELTGFNDNSKDVFNAEKALAAATVQKQMAMAEEQQQQQQPAAGNIDGEGDKPQE